MAASDITAAIDDLRARFLKVFESGDTTALGEFCTEDCKFLIPGKPMQTGRKAFVEAMASIVAAGVTKEIIKPVEISGGGDFAYECNEYTLLKDDGTVVDSGKCLVVFKKVGGDYRVHAECFNSNSEGLKF